MKEKKNIFSPIVIFLLLTIFVFLIFSVTSPEVTTTRISFFDVGQGDAALITTKNKQNIVVDGGPNKDFVSKIEKTLPFYHRKIDAVILSHPHSDHLLGLIELVKKYEINDIYLTGVVHTTTEYLDFLKLVQEKRIPVHIVKSGDKLELSSEEKIEFLFPLKSLKDQKVDNLNDSSIVFKYYFGQKSVLFTGDLETTGQAELLSMNPDLKADVLKVSHHGSKNGLDKTFLNKIVPTYAIISVGSDNKFGHPSQNTLNLLKSVKVFRTDQDGDVVLQIANDLLRVE